MASPTAGFYSLSCETYSGTGFFRLWWVTTIAVSIRCRARRTAEPHGPRSRGCRPVSIRCRARRTAERSLHHRHDAGTQVSIRCRARRTAELVGNAGALLGNPSFYSLSCEAYSGTPRPTRCPWAVRFLFAVVRDVQRNLRPLRSRPPRPRFYSLSCETYSGTLGDLDPQYPRGVSIRCRARRTAEREHVRQLRALLDRRFYSLSCETYSGTLTRADMSRKTSSFYSLSCETYSGTVGLALLGAVAVSIRCRARRTAEHQRSPPRRLRHVSIRCRARRTAERRQPRRRRRPRVSIRCRARRTAELDLRRDRQELLDRFYSLSCETYSGTGLRSGIRSGLRVSIRCRARRTAEHGQRCCGHDRPVVSIRCRARRTAEPYPLGHPF